MGRKRKQKFQKNRFKKPEKEMAPVLTSRLKRWISAILMIALSLVVVLSFVDKAGSGGQNIFKIFDFLIGKTVFVFPFLLLLAAFFALKPSGKRILLPVLAGLFLCLSGMSGFLAVKYTTGGVLGKGLSMPLLRFFSPIVAYLVFVVLALIGLLIFYEMLPKKEKEKQKEKPLFAKTTEADAKPKFEIKPIEVFRKKKDDVILPTPAPKTEPKKKEKRKEEESFALDVLYKVPPLNLLDLKEEVATGGDTEGNALIIQRTLQNFGIQVGMSDINVGPTVTQYSLKPAEGVKLSKITALSNDLALALAAHPLRIEAPIPGKPLVGIEVPNKQRAVVKAGSLIALDDFQKASPLTFALGRDVMGAPMFADLGRMPHLLVAGATGSGKTICLNTIILSLIFRNSPKILRLILIDPKKVEFPVYSNLPHLLTPVILNSRKAVNALNWLVGEMDRRFDVLREFGARDIGAYNSALVKKPSQDFEQLPFIVLVIDELADLMMAKGKEVEAAIVRLSQLARAVGIHLIVATQRPSVEVITGLIKANITSRIAFQVASQIDSRTILDAAGSEKLLGRGDMLFLSAEFSKPKRIQGVFISSNEIKKVSDFIVKENAPAEKEEIEENGQSEETPGVSFQPSSVPQTSSEDIMNYEAKDDLYDEAKDTVVQYQKASASLLQRRLQIGYARAARLLDMLEQNGVIGQGEGAKPRDVFVQKPGGTLELNDDGFTDPSKIEFEEN